MNLFVLSVTFAVMAGLLFYSEQTDTRFNTRTISSGWLIMGLLVRMTLMIVMLVLLAVGLSTLPF
jgi:hypothetical protein